MTTTNLEPQGSGLTRRKQILFWLLANKRWVLQTTFLLIASATIIIVFLQQDIILKIEVNLNRYFNQNLNKEKLVRRVNDTDQEEVVSSSIIPIYPFSQGYSEGPAFVDTQYWKLLENWSGSISNNGMRTFVKSVIISDVITPSLVYEIKSQNGESGLLQVTSLTEFQVPLYNYENSEIVGYSTQAINPKIKSRLGVGSKIVIWYQGNHDIYGVESIYPSAVLLADVKYRK